MPSVLLFVFSAGSLFPIGLRKSPAAENERASGCVKPSYPATEHRSSQDRYLSQINMGIHVCVSAWPCHCGTISFWCWNTACAPSLSQLREIPCVCKTCCTLTCPYGNVHRQCFYTQTELTYLLVCWERAPVALHWLTSTLPVAWSPKA